MKKKNHEHDYIEIDNSHSWCPGCRKKFEAIHIGWYYDEQKLRTLTGFTAAIVTFIVSAILAITTTWNFDLGYTLVVSTMSGVIMGLVTILVIDLVKSSNEKWEKEK